MRIAHCGAPPERRVIPQAGTLSAGRLTLQRHREARSAASPEFIFGVADFERAQSSSREDCHVGLAACSQ
jgi:hypothetical protein